MTTDEIINELESIKADAEFHYAVEDGSYEQITALREAIKILKNQPKECKVEHNSNCETETYLK